VHTVLEFLHDQPLGLLFVLMALGSLAGRIRIAGVEIGPVAVLFIGIAVSATGTALDVPLLLPELVGTLGLVLFTYTIGIVCGPTFFGALRTGWPAVLATAVGLSGVAAVAFGLGRLLGIPVETVAGAFSGALTCTPALAAASEVAGNASATTVGYSLCYPFGVVGMLLVAAALLRRPGKPMSTDLTNLTVEVSRPDLPPVTELARQWSGKVIVSRVSVNASDSAQVAVNDVQLRQGDLVTLVGERTAVERAAEDLGTPSTTTLPADRRHVDVRRVTLSKQSLSGLPVCDLGLDRFGAIVSRVRRGDVDMLAADDLVVQIGDRLRIVAPPASMGEVAGHLGDSDRGLSDINPFGLALGMTLGVLLGSLPLPLPGARIELGMAAGTLLTGLFLGYRRRIGPVMTTMPGTAASTLSSFGMLAFLAYAGTRAGSNFAAALSSGAGVRSILLGAVVTLCSAAVMVLGVARIAKVAPPQAAGMLAGSQTQPAVLTFANERTGFDTRVGVGYALVYPVAMVVKILMAQILAVG
jgi:putative transport protein